MSDTAPATVPQSVPRVIYVFLTHVGIAVICFNLFAILRTRNKVVYARKVKFYGEDGVDGYKRPPQMRDGFLHWFRELHRVADVKLLPFLGPDSMVLLRFLNMGMWMFLTLAVLGVCVFIPINIIAGPVENSAAWQHYLDQYQGQDRAQLRILSVQNIFTGSPFFWAPAFEVYLVTGVVLWFVYKCSMEVVAVRRAYLMSPEFLQGAHNRTLLLLNLPEALRTPEAMMQFARETRLPTLPDAISMGRDLKELPEATTEYNKLVLRFEGVISDHLAAQHKEEKKALKAGRPAKDIERPEARVDNKIPFMGGRKVDALTYFPEQLHAGEQDIYERRALFDECETAPFAFMVFPTIETAQAALTILRDGAVVRMRTRMVVSAPRASECPDSEDLLYDNCKLTQRARLIRGTIALLLTLALVLGWVFVTAFVMTLSKLSQLQSIWPGLVSWLQDHGFLVYLTQLLPPVLMAVLQLVLLLIMQAIVAAKGLVSHSGQEMNLNLWMFVFTIWNTVMLNVSGVFLQAGKALFMGDQTLQQQFPGQSLDTILLNITALSFVDNAAFFINLIVTQYSSYMIALVQAVPLVVAFIKQRLGTLRWRARYELIKPPPFDFVATYTAMLLPLFVSMLFSVIAPFILPFAALTFYIAWVSFKYQLLYIFETQYETGGRWWWRIFNYIIFALIFSQVILLVYLRIFSQIAHVELIVLVPIAATVIFWFVVPYRNKRFFATLSEADLYRMYHSEEALPTVEAPAVEPPLSRDVSSETIVNVGEAAASPGGTLQRRPWEDDEGERLDNATTLQKTTGGPAPEDLQKPHDAQDAADVLAAFVHPALTEPLEHVLVWPWDRPALDALYRPRYAGFADFLRQREQQGGVTSPSCTINLLAIEQSDSKALEAEHLRVSALARRATRVQRQHADQGRRMNRVLLRLEKDRGGVVRFGDQHEIPVDAHAQQAERGLAEVRRAEAVEASALRSPPIGTMAGSSSETLNSPALVFSPQIMSPPAGVQYLDDLESTPDPFEGVSPRLHYVGRVEPGSSAVAAGDPASLSRRVRNFFDGRQRDGAQGAAEAAEGPSEPVLFTGVSAPPPAEMAAVASPSVGSPSAGSPYGSAGRVNGPRAVPGYSTVAIPPRSQSRNAD